MATLLFSRGSVIVTSGLKFRVLQPQAFEDGRRLLTRNDVFKVGGLRGIRGSRKPDQLQPTDTLAQGGITLIKGEDLLKQLEAERNQLRSSKHNIANQQKEEEQKFDVKSKASIAEVKQSRFPKPQPKSNFLKEGNTNKLMVTSDNQFEVLNQVICPLFNLPYEEQLKLKDDLHVNIVRRLHNLSAGAKICKPGKINPSDVLTEYRTKDEFGIQRGLDGNPKTVGLFVGSSKSRIVCIEPMHIPIIKDSHTKVASAFQGPIQ